MSGNVYPNPCPIFPHSVCAGNVTWRGKSVQCCTCSKWVHLRCSQLSLSKFRALGSSHSWSFPSCRNTLCVTLVSKPPSSAPSPPSLAPGRPSMSPDPIRFLQWNAGDLRARSIELLHFLLSHPVDLICIQKSNSNSSFSFWILCSAF